MNEITISPFEDVGGYLPAPIPDTEQISYTYLGILGIYIFF